jgi:hypothetical protein
VAVLVEEPHVVIPKGSKPQKGRAGLRIRETSVTWSEETHASSTHEDNVGEDKEEENPPSKGKRVAFEDTEAEAWPEGPKRLKRTSAGPASKPTPLEKIAFSDESKDDPLQMGRKKSAPQRYVVAFTFAFK